MKKLFTFLIICANFQSFAQNRPTLQKANNSVKADIEKVVEDYYNHFKNIIGDTISVSINTIDYQSKIIPPGATQCIITKIKGLENVYSWEATMLNTEDFEKAVESYRKIYTQLNGSNIIMNDKKSWKFIGDYDKPEESRAFASSILEPNIENKAIQRLKVEVALNYIMPNWSLRILVYEKEADEDIRPTESTSR